MAETVDGLQDLSLTWSGRALDIGRIEAELDKLRYMVAGQPAGGPGFALRTSLLNMVVYAEHEGTGQYASRAIEDLSTHHPSRALIVIARPSEEESHIEAQLAAHCHMSQALEQTVCCEEVTLNVAGRAAKHLRSIIVPLLVPDLPVYVWWMEGIPDDPHVFLELLEASDHMIVDSGRFADQPGAMLQLHKLAEQVTRPTVGDLNWGRLDAWRELLQQQKHLAEMRHHFSSVKSVEIRYARGEGDRSGQAFLYLAWLAGELGWTSSAVSSHGAGKFTLRAEEDRRVSVFLQPIDYPAIDPGLLVSLKIACQSETARALLTISRTGDPHHLTIRTEHRGGTTEDNVRIEQDTTSLMLMRELDAPHDAQYNRVLRAAVPLVMAARAS